MSQRSPFKGQPDGYQKVLAAIDNMVEMGLLGEQATVSIDSKNQNRVLLFVTK